MLDAALPVNQNHAWTIGFLSWSVTQCEIKKLTCAFASWAGTLRQYGNARHGTKSPCEEDCLYFSPKQLRALCRRRLARDRYRDVPNRYGLNGEIFSGLAAFFQVAEKIPVQTAPTLTYRGLH